MFRCQGNDYYTRLPMPIIDNVSFTFEGAEIKEINLILTIVMANI